MTASPIGGGRILAVGVVRRRGRAGRSTTCVEGLAGQWLLPAFHDSHVHPVQAGLEVNQCDLSGLTDGRRVPRAACVVRRRRTRTARGSPAAAGRWTPSPAASRPPSCSTACARTGRSSCPTATTTRPGSTSSRARACGHRRAHARPGRRPHRAGSDGRPTGALHEGAMALVGRLVAGTDGGRAAGGAADRAARTCTRSASSAGRTRSSARGSACPTRSTPTSPRTAAGLLTAKVVLALWWDRERGLEQVPELLERRRRAAGRRARRGDA